MRARSLLYVPADNERFIAKAHTRGPDVVILDLEDSVKPERRDLARQGLSEAVASAGQSGSSVFVRINDGEAVADVEAAQKAGAHAIYVSKANEALIETLAARFADLPLFALIEDPASMLRAEAIAAHPNVAGMAIGGEDLATALGAEPSAETLKVPRLMLHYAAKAHGKLSIGLFRTVADYSDIEGIRAAADEARRHGIDGASCVHPSAVTVLNEAFSPNAEQVDWARRVIEADATSALGSFTIDGKMVDAPVVARARSILAKIAD